MEVPGARTQGKLCAWRASSASSGAGAPGAAAGAPGGGAASRAGPPAAGGGSSSGDGEGPSRGTAQRPQSDQGRGVPEPGDLHVHAQACAGEIPPPPRGVPGGVGGVTPEGEAVVRPAPQRVAKQLAPGTAVAQKRHQPGAHGAEASQAFQAFVELQSARRPLPEGGLARMELRSLAEQLGRTCQRTMPAHRAACDRWGIQECCRRSRRAAVTLRTLGGQRAVPFPPAVLVPP